MKKKGATTVTRPPAETTDADGKRWIQTSPEDLFSVKELNEVLASIERDTKADEIVLARIDFRKVDREYFEAYQELAARFRRQSELFKATVAEAKEKIERKNRKLRELIEYIRKLHILIAHLTSDQDASKTRVPPEVLSKIQAAPSLKTETEEDEYVEVEEIPLPLD